MQGESDDVGNKYAARFNSLYAWTHGWFLLPVSGAGKQDPLLARFLLATAGRLLARLLPAKPVSVLSDLPGSDKTLNP